MGGDFFWDDTQPMPTDFRSLIADPDDRDHCRQQTSIDAKFACIATWADEVRNDNRFGKEAYAEALNSAIDPQKIHGIQKEQ